MTQTSSTPLLSRGRLAVLHIVAVAVLGAAAAPMQAQSLADQTRGDRPVNVISANPFLPLFGYFQGEFEHSLKPSVSIAIAGSYVKLDNTKYANLDAKLRLYPKERGLEGINVAASLGLANITDEDGSYGDCISEPPPAAECKLIYDKFGAGAFAIEMGYQWLLGPSKVMAIGIGVGAKRYIASKGKFRNVQQVMPTLRLNIGYAF